MQAWATFPGGATEMAVVVREHGSCVILTKMREKSPSSTIGLSWNRFMVGAIAALFL